MLKVNDSIIYNQVLEKLKNNFFMYEKMIEGTVYSLWLANGDFLKIKIERNQVPHLLGVNTNLVKIAGNLKKETSAMDVFQKLINCEITDYNIKNKGINLESVFSDYIDVKLDAFIKNLKIRTDDVYAIVKYKKDRSYKTGEETENSDYFIIRYLDRKYYVLGVANTNIDKIGNIYQPVTSRVFDSEEDINKFLDRIAKNQEITYANSFMFENYEKGLFTEHPVSLNLDQKKNTIDRIIKLAQKISAIPSMGNDLLYVLSKLSNSYQKNNNNVAVYKALISAIKDGNILSPNQITEDICDYNSLDQDLIMLIGLVNDSICLNINNSNGTLVAYSTMQKENNTLKEELEKMKKELEEVKNRINTLSDEKKVLEEENSKNKQIIKIFDTAILERNKLVK